MLPQLEVKVAEDTLRDYTKAKPLHALSELIWNAFDADANQVDVTIESSDIEGVRKIVVKDDGHGLAENKVVTAFGSLGGSPKRSHNRTSGGRILHGSNGRGRYRALALGADVTWEFRQSSRDLLVGSAYTVQILSETLSTPKLAEAQPTSAEPGCTVTVGAPFKSANDLLTAETVEHIGGLFASHLLANSGTSIILNGQEIDPRVDLVDEQECIVLRGDAQANIHMLFWRDRKRKPDLYLCRADGVALTKEPKPPKIGGISYTAYVSSEAFQQDWDEEFGTISESTTSLDLRKAADSVVRDLLRKHIAKETKGTIDMLINEGSYPYKGDPETPVEEAEREVFNIAASQLYELNPAMLEATAESRKVKMQVLAAAIEAEPTSRDRIIQKVFNLSKADADAFADVLDKVDLAQVVSMVNRVYNRMHFMTALRAIVYNPNHKKRLKERTQLHRILLDDLWIFGEQYSLAASDAGLRTILRNHIAVLGRTELAEEVDESNLSMDRIPDLLLERKIGDHEGNREHLVIELKRPSVKVGSAEFNQISDYATTIADHPSFDKAKTKWKFIVVSSEVNERQLSFALNQKNRHPRLASDSENFTIWVYTWAQLLAEAEGRMEFLRQALELDVSEEEAEDYLRRTRRPEALPSSLSPKTD